MPLDPNAPVGAGPSTLPLSPEQASKLRDQGLITPQTYSTLYPEPPAQPAAPAPAAAEPDPFAGFIDSATAQKKAEEEAKANEERDMAAKQHGLKSDILQYKINQAVKDGKTPEQIRKEFQDDVNELENYKKMAGMGAPTMQPAPMPTAEAPAQPPADVQLVSDQPSYGAEGMVQPSGPTPGMDTTGFDVQQDAVRLAASAGVAKAAEQQAFLDRMVKDDANRLEAMQASEAERTAKVDAQFKKLEEASERLNAMQVDPERFWKNKTTGEKIMAGIALFLGAAGSNGNRAAKVIHDSIDRDIAAQKAAVETAKGAYSARAGIYNDMVSLFKDRRVAEEATRLAYLKNAETSIKSMEARYEGAEVKAKAAQLLGEIEQKKIETRLKFNEAMQKTLPASGATDPEMLDKDRRERFVPGFGLALSKDDAEKAKAFVGDTMSTKDTVKQLLLIADKPGRSTDLATRAEAQTLASMLQGQLRLAVLGPGAVTDREREVLEKIIADPTKIFALDTTTRATLGTVMQRLDRNLAAKMGAYGLRTNAEKLGFKSAGR